MYELFAESLLMAVIKSKFFSRIFEDVQIQPTVTPITFFKRIALYCTSCIIQYYCALLRHFFLPGMPFLFPIHALLCPRFVYAKVVSFLGLPLTSSEPSLHFVDLTQNSSFSTFCNRY